MSSWGFPTIILCVVRREPVDLLTCLCCNADRYKKVAIADGCKPHDPFADDECESWFEQMFGINLLEVFGLDEVIDGVVEIVGTVGRPLVRVALDVIDEIEDALCFWCEGPAEAPPPALPSGCTETAKILTDKGTLVTKRKVVSTVTTTNKETGDSPNVLC